MNATIVRVYDIVPRRVVQYYYLLCPSHPPPPPCSRTVKQEKDAEKSSRVCVGEQKQAE